MLRDAAYFYDILNGERYLVILRGIFDISTLVPGIGFLLLGLVLWFWYPLHKKQVDENVRKLKERR